MALESGEEAKKGRKEGSKYEPLSPHRSSFVFESLKTEQVELLMAFPSSAFRYSPRDLGFLLGYLSSHNDTPILT